MSTTQKFINRRQLLKVMGAGTGAALLAACGAAPAAPAAAPTAAPVAPATTAPATEAPPKPTEAPKPTDTAAAEAAAATATATPATEAKPTIAPKAAGAKALPADAAPAEQQILVLTGDPGQTWLDPAVQLYNTHVTSGNYSLPLVRLDHDFGIKPGAAKSWSVDDKGSKWTFVLRDDVKWTDGKPLNAEDFVVTFQRYADPAVAYDFNWYFSEAKVVNFDEATGGKAKIEDIAVKQGANEYELTFETKSSVPYFPLLFIYFWPLHAKLIRQADGKWNEAYNLDPATAVSAGPFVLKENSPDRVVAEANPNVPDDLKPYLQKIIGVPLPKDQRLQAYQAGQIDYFDLENTADIEAVEADANLSKQVTPDVGDFRNDYFFFDVTSPPFDNKSFRQAISHLVDRDSIVANITKPIAGIPAYGFLAPGFPGHNPELKTIQDFDVEKAKSKFKESGVDPAAVGKLTIEVRANGGETRKTIAENVASQIKEHLGIEVEVKLVEQKVFMEALNAKPTQVRFGFVSYGMDYLDQSNMLSVFKTGGRHNWNNAEFQKLLDEAGPLNDKAKRDDLYKQAEKLLVEEAPAVFVVFRTVPKLLKPYVSGETLKPGKTNTVPGLSWPGFDLRSQHPENLYINKSVTELRPTPPA